MGVNKIVFVSTEDIDMHDKDLSAIAKKQLNAVAKHCFSANDKNNPVAFRVTSSSLNTTIDNVIYLRERYNQILKNSKADVVSIISDATDIHEILECTKKGSTVLIGVTPEELPNVLASIEENNQQDPDEDDLDHNYPVEDTHGQYADRIQNKKNIYVYTIFPHDKEHSDFQEFPWSHYEELVKKMTR